MSHKLGKEEACEETQGKPISDAEEDFGALSYVTESSKVSTSSNSDRIKYT